MGNMDSLNLNVEEESKGMSDYSVLPDGEYQVIITEAEMKANKSGQGAHIGVSMQVIEGECEGRLLWANYNVQNSNPTAEKIGRAELASLCKAIGIINPQDTSELCDKPFIVNLGLDKKDPTKNKIKSYIVLEIATSAPVENPEAPKPAPATVPVTTPAAGKPKVWQRKK